MVLPKDNSFEESNSYLSKRFQRYVSETARSESEEKIESIRRISLKIIDFINQYAMENSINPLNSHKHHIIIKKEFIDQYGDNDYPENMKRSRFINLVSEFFTMHETEIDDLLLRHDDQDLITIINSTSRKSLDKLSRIIDKYYCITFIKTANKINDLHSIGIHNKDAILLDESYCLHLFLKKIIYFITFDKDILEAQDSIKEVLNKNINVAHPNSV